MPAAAPLPRIGENDGLVLVLGIAVQTARSLGPKWARVAGVARRTLPAAALGAVVLASDVVGYHYVEHPDGRDTLDDYWGIRWSSGTSRSRR